MILLLALAAAVQHPVAVGKIPNPGAAPLRADPYPWLASSGYMKTWYWFCDHLTSAPDDATKQRYGHAIRLMRQQYQGDLSQRAYKCWTELP
jgi:hypothetical protein